MTKSKAIAMLSGGLDSILATRLIADQGIAVEAINFRGFFCSCKGSGPDVDETAKLLGVPLRVVNVGCDYLAMLRNPKHGYGKNMNPCVDCKIFMLKEAKRYAKQVGASFVFTGEVLNERPMSQHFEALRIIEEEAGLKGRLLRPLSARLLPETIPEREGIVDRDQLLSLSGRSRKPQIELAKKLGIDRFPSPAGGCLLTEVEFASRLRDLFRHKKRCSADEVALLRIGRHFRFGDNKIIVGREEKENKVLLAEKGRNDFAFEASGVPGPISILQGAKSMKAIELAAKLTAFYADSETPIVKVDYGREKLDKSIAVEVPRRTEVERLRIHA